MVDEGRVSARFVLRRMRGVSSSSSSPVGEGDGDLEGGTAKTSYVSHLVPYLMERVLMCPNEISLLSKDVFAFLSPPSEE